MKKTFAPCAFFLVFLTALHAQQRALIISQDVVLEADPPQNIEEMVSITHLVAHVRIESRKASLDPDGIMMWIYKAELLGVAYDPEASLQGRREIEITERGGIFYNGAVIRVNQSEITANLSAGEEYVLFLTEHPNSSYVLQWGKFAAFQVVSGFVVPLTPAKHPYYELYAGLRLSDFLALAGRDMSDARAALGLPSGHAKRIVR